METVLDLRLVGGGDRGFGMAAGGGDRRVWDRWELGFFVFVDFRAPQQLTQCLVSSLRESERDYVLVVLVFSFYSFNRWCS